MVYSKYVALLVKHFSHQAFFWTSPQTNDIVHLLRWSNHQAVFQHLYNCWNVSWKVCETSLKTRVPYPGQKLLLLCDWALPCCNITFPYLEAQFGCFPIDPLIICWQQRIVWVILSSLKSLWYMTSFWFNQMHSIVTINLKKFFYANNA